MPRTGGVVAIVLATGVALALAACGRPRGCYRVSFRYSLMWRIAARASPFWSNSVARL